MRKVQIITDSCSDLTPELLARHNIVYAKMNVCRNSREMPALLSWENGSPHEFYNAMRQGEVIKTTQVPVAEFEALFKHYLETQTDIVYIGCATKQSGLVNTAAVVAGNLKEMYPHAEIYCIDALNASLGEGMLAIYAATLAESGCSAKEIFEQVCQKRNCVQEYVAVNTLEYLKRAGRVKGSAAFFGNLMGVKPILIADAAGAQTPIKKVKGRENSLREIVALMKEGVLSPEKQTLYIAHGDCAEAEIETLKKIIGENISFKDIQTCYIGPIIGASVGPDAIGIFAFGKEVTYEYKG